MKYRPTEAQILELKKPLGQLFKGDPAHTMSQLTKIVRNVKPSYITMVGDVVSQSAFEAGIPVNLRIVDHKTKRARIDTASYSSTNTFHVTNPAGVIDENVFRIIRKAMTQREALIIVDGEEDLLTIPTVLESPNESLVVYGQPNEGIVVITVTEIDKKQVRKLLDEMHHEE